MLPAMFIVSEEAAAAIRNAYEQEGELSAAIEVQRLFPGVTDNAEGLSCARTIAGWQPLPAAACKITPFGRSEISRRTATPLRSRPATMPRMKAAPLVSSDSGAE
jgi:hypothetical protein